jgi:hypothetical protein
MKQMPGHPVRSGSSVNGMRRSSCLNGISERNGAAFSAKDMLRSDIQPRVEACIECVSLPHARGAWVRDRFDGIEFMALSSCPRIHVADGGIWDKVSRWRREPFAPCQTT